MRFVLTKIKIRLKNIFLLQFIFPNIIVRKIILLVKKRFCKRVVWLWLGGQGSVHSRQSSKTSLSALD